MTGAILCLLFVEKDCRAQDEWTVSAANWMQYWYFEDSSAFQAARRDSLDNRFILDFNLGDFYTGMWLKILQLNRPDESSEEMTQRYFGWNQNGLTLHAGNFYQVFDRGLTLNTFLDDAVYYDNNLDGIKVSGLYNRFDFDAFSARGLNFNTGERNYILRGVRGSARPIEQASLGFSYVRLKQNDTESFFESLNANITGIHSGINAGPLELYGEYAYKRGKTPQYAPQVNGDGTYLSGSLSFEKFSIYSEYKNIINMIYPNAQNRFNSPPPASHSGRSLTDLAGTPGERGYQVGTLISPTFDINLELAYSESFSRSAPTDLYLGEKFAGLRWELSSDMVMNYNWDRIDYSFEDEIDNYFDLYYYINYDLTFSATIYSRHFFPKDSDDYFEDYFTYGLSIANRFQLNVGGSKSNRENDPNGDPKKLAFAELTIRFTSHELVIFTGGERGGLICSSGICQNRPTFTGTRIMLFSRF